MSALFITSQGYGKRYPGVSTFDGPGKMTSQARRAENSPRREPCGDEELVKMVPAPEGRQTMAHTFANLLTPVIFSTKDRQPLSHPTSARTGSLIWEGSSGLSTVS